MKTIVFTPSMQRRFKAAYEEAKVQGKETFTFDGNEFLLDYAKYMIEYMEMENKKYATATNN